MATAELVSVDWADVQAKTGAAGRRKGLADYKDKHVRLNTFFDEKRGKKNVHYVMTATVESDGEDSRSVIVPDRYAGRVREYASRRQGGFEGLQIEGIVQVSDKGTIMIKALPKPESANGQVRRRGRPRRNPEQHTPPSSEQN